jgi:enhancing lycopene biosynthesis protein 2
MADHLDDDAYDVYTALHNGVRDVSVEGGFGAVEALSVFAAEKSDAAVTVHILAPSAEMRQLIRDRALQVKTF